MDREFVDGATQVALHDSLVPAYQRKKPRGLAKSVDTVNWIPSAGRKVNMDNESVSQCIKAGLDTRNSPQEIPAEQLKWRSSFQTQPALQFSSPGTYGLPTHTSSNNRYGVRTSFGDKAGDCIQSSEVSYLQDFYQAQKEKNYASHRLEPLGTHFTRGHVLPDFVNDEEFRFGKKTIGSESAKNVINFQDTTGAQDELNREQDVTRQTNRQYNWGTVDPASFRFGRAPSNVHLASSKSVEECLKQSDNVKATRVISTNQRDVRNYQHDRLGRQKPKRDVLAKVGENFVFGKESASPDWSVKRCIEGLYSAEEQLPDRDLGTSMRHLSILSAVPTDPTRTYGVPSIRVDKAQPILRRWVTL